MGCTDKYTEFGTEVRVELLKKHKSISWLAKEIGCSTGHLSEMLRGSRDVSNWKEKIKGVLAHDEGSRATNF